MFEPRMLNGYRLIYRPDYPRAIKSGGYKGFVYEHIYIMELFIGRPLQANEEVHHLDFDRANNRLENLLLLSSSMHSRLHSYLKNCDAIMKVIDENRMNSVNPKYNFCAVCGLTLQRKQIKYCSMDCELADRYKRIPSKSKLISLCKKYSKSKIAEMYKVSARAVYKWLKRYTAIPSQVDSTLSKGVETSGLVQSN